MKRAIIVPTCRPDGIITLLNSMDYLPDDWDVLVSFNNMDKESLIKVKNSKNGDRITIATIVAERMHPYPQRINLLEKYGSSYDVICNLDDDMELLLVTNYDPACERVLEPDVGVVSCNWVKHENGLIKKKPVDEWIKQSIVNMSGGLLMGQKVTEILLDSPIKPYAFDDIQIGLMAYIHGLTNYRYKGSILIHRIMSKGGHMQLYKMMHLAFPDPKLCTTYPSKEHYDKYDNNWLMVVPANLTPYAHQLHKENKRG